MQLHLSFLQAIDKLCAYLLYLCVFVLFLA